MLMRPGPEMATRGWAISGAGASRRGVVQSLVQRAVPMISWTSRQYALESAYCGAHWLTDVC